MHEKNMGPSSIYLTSVSKRFLQPSHHLRAIFFIHLQFSFSFTSKCRCLMSAAQIFIIVISVLFAVRIVSCVLNRCKMGARSWSDQHKRQQPPTRQLQQPQYTYPLTPTTTSMMFSPAAGQERPTSYDEAALRDHIVRLKSLKTDLALNLPHTIALPDGEEYPGCNFNHIRLHNAEQQAEMMNNYIRPPPNRTISNCTPVPYFTANSVGHFPKHPILTLSVPRYNYARGGKVGSLGASLDSNPCVSSPHDAAGMYAVPGNAVAGNDFAGMAIAGSFHMSGANGNSNGMDGYIRDVTDNQRGAIDDPPPPYSDVVVCKGKCSE